MEIWFNPSCSKCQHAVEAVRAASAVTAVWVSPSRLVLVELGADRSRLPIERFRALLWLTDPNEEELCTVNVV